MTERGLIFAALAFATATLGPEARSRPLLPDTIGAAALADPGSRPQDPVARWRPYVEEASRRFGVPVDWIERVMRAESGGSTTLRGRPIISHAGAMGLMQLMPATWAAMRARHGLGTDPFDPRDNILAGTAYLAAMHAMFGYPGLFGAYNAGPARYADWLAGRRTLPAETRAYLAKVTGAEVPIPVNPGAAGSTANASSGPVAAALPGNESSIRSRLFAIDRASVVTAAPPAKDAANTLFIPLASPFPAIPDDRP